MNLTENSINMFFIRFYSTVPVFNDQCTIEMFPLNVGHSINLDKSVNQHLSISLALMSAAFPN